VSNAQAETPFVPIPWPPVIDLDAIRKRDRESSRELRLIEGLCANAIEVRRKILCELSAESGEWTSGSELKKFGRLYQSFMQAAHEISAESFEYPQWVVFAAMSKAAKEDFQQEVLPWK
jgi:hypothetical protein